MGSILGIGLTLLCILALSQGITLIIIASRMVKMPMWAPLLIPIARSAVEDVLPVLDTVRAELEHNGFRYMHTRRVRSIVAVSGIAYGYCDVYYHVEQDIHAEVYVSSLPTLSKLCDIYLWNTYVDGSAQLTVNNIMHSLSPYPRSVHIADGYAADLAGHMAAHLKARAQRNVARTDPADALDIAKTMADQYFPSMEKEGLVYRRSKHGGDVIYGFRFLTAIQTAWRMRKAAVLQKKNKPKVLDSANVLPPLDLDAARRISERVGFARTLCLLRGLRAPRWFRRTVFAFSAAAFLGLGTWWWGPAGAVTVALVILVHEAGHWAAMKLAKFRDVQVFFVPGMGGATSGEKHEAHPMTHLLVYLAGPVPGLLLSLAVFAWVAFNPEQPHALWYSLLLTSATTSLLINALNLLPVLPLDGGRVIELLIVGRLPWLRFIFAVCSGGLLFMAGMSGGDNILRGLGLLMLFASQQHYRVAKASALLLREAPSTTRSTASFSASAKELYDFLAKPAFSRWNFKTKLLVGQALLPRFLRRTPSWKETGLGLAVYMSCALLPLIAMAILVFKSPQAVMGAIGQGFAGAYSQSDAPSKSERETNVTAPTKVDAAALLATARQQRAATLAQAQGPEAQLAALKEAIGDANEDGDSEDALRLARLQYAQTSSYTAPAQERAQAALELASALSAADDKAGAQAEILGLQSEAEGILRLRLTNRRDKQDAVLLAEVLEARTPQADKTAMVAMRQETVTLLTSNSDPSSPELARARNNLARALYSAGQEEAAESALRLASTETSKAPDSPLNQQYMVNDLAWVLVAHHKLDEATQIAQSQLASPQGKNWALGSYQRDAHLILLMVARQNKDWNAASLQARALLDAQKKMAQSPGSGNWLLDVMLTRAAPPPDRQATLLLIDSERALGHGSEADQLLADMRASFKFFTGTVPASNACKVQVNDALWKRELQQTLLDIEQRELRCVPKS